MRRILLKISGEQLAGDNPHGFDIERAKWIAGQIKQAKEATGTEFVVVVGAGNFVRGADFAGDDIGRVTADNMGMLAIVINALALNDVFNSCGLPTVALSNLYVDQAIDQFTHRRAVHHLRKGRVVIVAGGTGRPYFTSDMSAASMAMELDCDVIAKATKVDGVYDDDPVKNHDARRFDKLTFDEAIVADDIRVMDKSALALAADHNKPIVVFELLHDGNIATLAQGQPVGTRIE
ncbi:uridylate kinase [Alphaproteobacteria bacterium]|nr:uridylate kinase [Alphaproteobacteria bacterium]